MDKERKGHELSLMPSPEDVNQGRDNKKVYMWFCQIFMEAVVGTVTWKGNKGKFPL